MKGLSVRLALQYCLELRSVNSQSEKVAVQSEYFVDITYAQQICHLESQLGLSTYGGRVWQQCSFWMIPFFHVAPEGGKPLETSRVGQNCCLNNCENSSLNCCKSKGSVRYMFCIVYQQSKTFCGTCLHEPKASIQNEQD